MQVRQLGYGMFSADQAPARLAQGACSLPSVILYRAWHVLSTGRVLFARAASSPPPELGMCGQKRLPGLIAAGTGEVLSFQQSGY